MSQTASQTSAEENERFGQIRSYDFRQPKLISKEVLRLMKGMHEPYLRHIKRMYSTLLGQPVNVTLSGTRQVNFSAYLSEIQQPSAIYTFNIEELGDWAVLELDPSFCIHCVELQSGGFGETPGEARQLTRVEQIIIDRLVGKMLRELSHIWSSYLPFTIHHHVYEPKPDSIRSISAHSNGILMHFSIEFGQETRPFFICYPYSLVESKGMKEITHIEDAPASHKAHPGDQKLLEEDLKRVEVDLKVLLGTTRMSLQQLISLSEGDTLMLDQPIEEPLKIRVGNQIKMTGYPGSMNGKRAVKIFNIAKNGMHSLDF
jgi:flagellar motor switch protein FliM